MEELRTYLEELLSLAKKQEELLGKEDIEGFQALGDDREKIISVIKDTKLTPEQVEERIILQEIDAIDKKNSKGLNKQFEALKAELKNLNDYSRRDRIYIDKYAGMESGRYFDKQDGRR